MIELDKNLSAFGNEFKCKQMYYGVVNYDNVICALFCSLNKAQNCVINLNLYSPGVFHIVDLKTGETIAP